MFGRPGFIRRHAWSLAGTLAAALLAPAFDWSALASPPDEVEESQPVNTGNRPTKPEVMVPLNHLSTPWDEVLQKLADGSHSTLVMHAVPQGRYSRHDWHKHTRTEAVRILNRDLEKLGYRILEKGQFLTVLEVQQSHVDYERPVVGERRASLATGEEQADIGAEGTGGIDAVEHEQQGLGSNQRDSLQRSRILPATSKSRNRRITQVQHVDSESESSESQAAEPGAAPETATPSVTITPTKRRATEIAKQIHRAFGNRSKLADAGPNGLPAFVVSHPQTKNDQSTGHQAQPHFTVEIDADRNELILTADAERVAHLENLIRMLDKASWTKGERQELVAGNTAAVAEKLQPQLSQLIAERENDPTARARRRSQALAQSDSPEEAPEVGATEELFNKGRQSTSEADEPQPGAMSEEKPGSKSAQDRLPALLDTLKGDVSLESMPDLDLLILRGNEKDVEAVMKVIRTIEQMAEGSTPEIHLRRLEHVDSQSLAGLLTQVYERMVSLRTGTAQKSEAQIAVIPVVTPNAVLILAPGNALDSVLELTKELDQQVDPHHHVEVYPLEHAIASQVVTTIEGFYPNDATLRPGLSTRIRVSADTRTNSVIVQAQPRDMEEVRGLIKRIDRDEAGSVSRAKVIKLKSANAEELAEFLQQAVQSVISSPTTTGGAGGVNAGGAGGQNTQQLRETKSVVLEFLAHDESTKELVRSGLLSDVRINADPRTNSLLVTAPKQSLILIEELVRVLDMPSSAVAEIKVFQLKNADAQDAVTLLTALFAEAATGQQTGTIGVQLAGTSDVGSNLVPLKFSIDGRTNSVIAIGGGDALRIVEAILFRLDDNDVRNRKTSVVKLRNNPAQDIANAINEFLQSQRDLSQIDPTRTSSSQLLDQEVIVTPEPLSNSLIISATPRYFDSIMDLTSQLDREQQQVAIQALLVEVALEDNDQFGVELGFQDSLLFDRSVKNAPTTIQTTTTAPNGVVTTNNTIISQTATPGFPFNNLPLGNNIAANPAAVGTQALSNFSLGRTDNSLGYGGLVLSASSNSVNVLIRALAARRNVRVLSRPSVTVLDSQRAQIQVGQIVPVANGATTNQTGTVTNVLRDNAGIILTVTPRISQEGKVVMEVAAEKSQYTGAGVPIVTNGNTGTVTAPIKDITTALTTVKVPDGQTIVLGGMITNSEDTIERKVPWLGDIPLVGAAFRYDSHAHRRSELLIFLTPRVIRCDQDAEDIKRIEAQRIHYFEDEAELIHGPLFGVPREDADGNLILNEPTWNATATPLPLQSVVPPTPTPELIPNTKPNENGTPAADPSNEEAAPQPIQQMRGESPASPRHRTPRSSLFKKNSKVTR